MLTKRFLPTMHISTPAYLLIVLKIATIEGLVFKNAEFGRPPLVYCFKKRNNLFDDNHSCRIAAKRLYFAVRYWCHV